MRHQHLSQHRRGGLLGIFGSFDHFDAAGFAPAAGVNLRLDDDRAAHLARDRRGFRCAVGDAAARHRYPERLQKLFRLILVDVHCGDGDSRPTKERTGILPLSVSLSYLDPETRSIAATSSFTCDSETSNSCFSRAESCTSMTFSTPPAPIITGTPK